MKKGIYTINYYSLSHISIINEFVLCRSHEPGVGHASRYDAPSATATGSSFEERGRGGALTSRASPTAACTPATTAASSFSPSRSWTIPPFAIVFRRAAPFHIVGDAEPARRGAPEERGKRRRMSNRPVVYRVQLSPYVSAAILPDRLSRDANVSSRSRQTLGARVRRARYAGPRVPFEPLLRTEVRYTLGGPSSIFIGNK